MKKILIVDDDADIRNQLLAILSAMGHDTYDAESGKAALTALKTTEIDLVILDQIMEGMSGTDVAEELNKTNTPFLFCSASTELELLLTAISLGALDYIIKPFEAPDLLLKVTSAINKIEIAENDNNVIKATSFIAGHFDLTNKEATARLRKIARSEKAKIPTVAKQINKAFDLINQK